MERRNGSKTSKLDGSTCFRAERRNHFCFDNVYIQRGLFNFDTMHKKKNLVLMMIEKNFNWKNLPHETIIVHGIGHGIRLKNGTSSQR